MRSRNETENKKNSDRFNDFHHETLTLHPKDMKSE